MANLKQFHASRRLELGDESSSRNPTELSIFYIHSSAGVCELKRLLSPATCHRAPRGFAPVILAHFNKDDPVCLNSYELILTGKT